MKTDWRSCSEELGKHLAYLLGLERATHPADLDTALHARTAALQLATAVHFDVSGVRRTPLRGPGSSSRYVHPVVHLVRVLQSQRRPTPHRSLTEVMSEGPRDRIGGLWREAARYAVLAHHEWMSIPAPDRQLGPTAWTAMHELAQFTHAVSWLDEDLVTSCRAAGRPDDASALQDSSAHLRPAAAAVATLATSGPLPPLAHLHGSTKRAAIRALRPDHLPAALDRLTDLLSTTSHVGPMHVQSCYRVLARAVAGAAETLVATTPLRSSTAPQPDVGASTADSLFATMRQNAELLHLAGRAPGRVHTLDASDPVVVVQLQLISDLVRSRAGHDTSLDRRAAPGRSRQLATEVLHASTRTATALHVTVTDHLEKGKWLVPAGEGAPSAMTWILSSPHHADARDLEAPSLLKFAARARGQSAELAARLPPRAAPGGRSPTSRPDSRVAADLLAGALAVAERRAAPIAGRATSVRSLGR